MKNEIVKKGKREITAYEETVVLELSVPQAQTLLALLARTNGSVFTELYYALENFFRGKTLSPEAQRIKERLSVVDLHGVLKK